MQQNFDNQQPKQTAFIQNLNVNSKIDLKQQILLTEQKSYYQHQVYSEQMLQFISRNDGQSIKNIIQTHDKLKVKENYHQNILKIFQIDLSNPTEIIIISDKCDCTLKQLFKQRENYWFSNEEICNIIGQIINGYCYLKENGIIYKNLHPDSIFIKYLPQQLYLVILSDYSNCMFESEQISNQIILPPYNYVAPECIKQNNQEYTFLSDIFSLGIILYQLCYQQQLSQTEQEHLKMLKSIQIQQQLQLPQNTNVSRQLLELLQRMLQYYPQNRINWEQLQQQQQLKLQFKIIQGYCIQFNKKIGSGNQASVYQAINLTTQEFCCAKLVYNNQTEGQREIEIYQKLKSKSNLNVVKVFDILKDNNKTYLIIEKCDESIETYYFNNKPLDKATILNILKQVVDGYCHLQQLQILHRDLKAQNILVKYQNNKPYFKIIDFGVGKILDKRELTNTSAGTPYATAPEVLEQKDHNYQCDIYSLGVLLFEITFSRQYIEANTLNELIQKLQKLERQPFKCPQSLYGNSLSECQKYFTPLIENLLQYCPDKRLKWKELQELIAQNTQNQSDQFLIPQCNQYNQHQQLINNNNEYQANQQQTYQNNNSIRIINQQQQQNQQMQIEEIQTPQSQPVQLLGGFLTHNSTTTDNIICYLTCLYVLSTKTKIELELFNKQQSNINNLINGLLYFIYDVSQLCLNDILKLIDKKSILIQDYFIEEQTQNQTINIEELNKLQHQLQNDIQFKEPSISKGTNQFFKQKLDDKKQQELKALQTSFEGVERFIIVYNSVKYDNKKQLDLKQKYYLEKLSNVYKEYPIEKYKQYKISEITLKIYSEKKAQDYCKEKQLL